MRQKKFKHLLKDRLLIENCMQWYFWKKIIPFASENHSKVPISRYFVLFTFKFKYNKYL